MRFSEELCPFLEPRDNWTTIQVDFEWTSEGTDEFLGDGDEDAPIREPRSVSSAGSRSLEPEDGEKVRDEGGKTRSIETLPRKAGVKGRLYHLTTGGLIGVMWRAAFARPAVLSANQRLTCSRTSASLSRIASSSSTGSLEVRIMESQTTR